MCQRASRYSEKEGDMPEWHRSYLSSHWPNLEQFLSIKVNDDRNYYNPVDKVRIHEIHEFILIKMYEWTESINNRLLIQFESTPPTQIIFIKYKTGEMVTWQWRSLAVTSLCKWSKWASPRATDWNHAPPDRCSEKSRASTASESSCQRCTSWIWSQGDSRHPDLTRLQFFKVLMSLKLD